MTRTTLQWIESAGGPLLLLPRSLLQSWDGAEFSHDREVTARARWIPEGPPTDYDRACDVGEIGIIPVGAGHGLVFGDEPLPTAWWPTSDPPGGIVVRWVYAASDEDVVHAMGSLPSKLFERSYLRFPVADSGLLLFDSAMPGRDIVTPSHEIELPVGVYEIATARYAPDAETSLLLHRMTLAGPAGSNRCSSALGRLLPQR